MRDGESTQVNLLALLFPKQAELFAWQINQPLLNAIYNIHQAQTIPGRLAAPKSQEEILKSQHNRHFEALQHITTTTCPWDFAIHKTACALSNGLLINIATWCMPSFILPAVIYRSIFCLCKLVQESRALCQDTLFQLQMPYEKCQATSMHTANTRLASRLFWRQ